MTPTSTPPPAQPTATAEPAQRPSPLRNGNRPGNPNAAPRCGAKARTTGCPCRAPAMPNGRCRMHGGTSTGPRTPQGMARMIAALTRHGLHGEAGAPKRAQQVYVGKANTRGRLTAQAFCLSAHLPPDMAARLAAGPEELWPPIHPSNLPFVNPAAATPHNPKPRAKPKSRRPAGDPASLALRTRQNERDAARAEAAALAPWRAAIALARAAKKAAPAAAPRPATGPTRLARSNPVQPENPARAAAPRPAAPRPATVPTRPARSNAIQPGTPAVRPGSPTHTLTGHSPTKAGLLRTTTQAETRDHAATRTTLDALFGNKPPPGWHPPQANPPGRHPPHAAPAAPASHAPEPRPQQRHATRADDRRPANPTRPAG
jgi:hypothetical protein